MSQMFGAVDLGASSGRVIIGRIEDGALVTRETARFVNGPVALPRAGGTTLHWDILRLYSGVIDGLRRAGREYGQLAGIGIDSWAADYGLLDAEGALVSNPVHYRDERTRGLPAKVFEHIPVHEHYSRTGVQVQPFNTIFQLAAGAGTAQLAAACRLLLVPDLLGYWLSGVEVTEVTNASTTGLLDVTSHRWSAPVLRALDGGFGTSVGTLLAPVVEPGTRLGALRPEVVDSVDQSAAELIAVGSHDTASALVAVPASSSEFAFISCGTWSLVGVELTHPVLTEESRAANFTNELGVDGTVRYLRNVMGLWLVQECVRTWSERGGKVELDRLLAAAADVPPLRCVIDVDEPGFMAPGDMPARVVDAATRLGQRPPQTPAEIVRCIVDSLALAYRRAVHQASALAGREVGVVHMVGGGSRNALLCQLTADATGLPVVAGPAEAAAMGNLLVQARALGAVEGDLPYLRAVVESSARLARFVPGVSQTGWDNADRTVWPRR